MTDIVIYTTNYCPYCTRAKELLKRKGIEDIKEIDVTSDEALRRAMVEKAGGKTTVPQIFINGKHVGGYDDMVTLDREGQLDSMLAAA